MKKVECTQCGICMECCPVVKSKNVSITSQLNELSATGAWNCVNCWKCIEICPSNVDIYSFMMARRKKENMPRSIEQIIKNITGKGFAFDIQRTNQVRKMYDSKPIRLIETSVLKILVDF